MNNTNFFDTIICFLVLAYIICLMAGTAYLVDQRGWSAWWFLLTILLISATKISAGVSPTVTNQSSETRGE